jgi:amidase
MIDFDTYAGASALELADLVRSGAVTPLELVDTAIARIEQVDGAINAVTTRTFDLARDMAKGELPDGPFRGVPYLAKDARLMWAGVRTTNGLSCLSDFVAPFDSALATRMKAAGFVLVGKSAAPPLSLGIATQSALFGITRNPYDLERVPGGSSGGAAAAVAARMVPIAHASDAGGSIRIPASNCGLVGLKPGRGRITTAPLAADVFFGSATENCVARTVADAAAHLDILVGSTRGDPYETPLPAEAFLSHASPSTQRFRIGVMSTTFDGSAIDQACLAVLGQATLAAAEDGHVVSHMDPSVPYDDLMAGFLGVASVATARGLDQLGALLGRPIGPGDVNGAIWAMAEQGRTMSGIEHLAAYDAIKTAAWSWAQLFAEHDILLMPTVPVPPQPVDFYDPDLPLDAYFERMQPHMQFALPFSLCGQPAISLPMGSVDGLPIGVQAVAPLGEEARLLRFAAAMERKFEWHERAPVL